MLIDIQLLIKEIGNNKNDFLDGVEETIKTYIEKKSWQECLTIEQLEPNNAAIKSTWSPKISSDYLKRLVAFMRGNQYEEGGFFSSKRKYDLDSGLTQGVVDVVTKEFNKFYTSEYFSNILFQQLMKDKIFAATLSNEISEKIIIASNGIIGTTLKRQLAEQLAYALQNAGGDALATAIGTALKAVVGKLIALIAATSISKAVLAVIMKNMIIMLKGILAKVLATTALKATLMSLLKKLVAAKIVAAVVALRRQQQPNQGFQFHLVGL